MWATTTRSWRRQGSSHGTTRSIRSADRPDEMAQRRQKLGIGCWNGSGGLYGTQGPGARSSASRAARPGRQSGSAAVRRRQAARRHGSVREAVSCSDGMGRESYRPGDRTGLQPAEGRAHRCADGKRLLAQEDRSSGRARSRSRPVWAAMVQPRPAEDRRRPPGGDGAGRPRRARIRLRTADFSLAGDGAQHHLHHHDCLRPRSSLARTGVRRHVTRRSRALSSHVGIRPIA